MLLRRGTMGAVRRAIVGVLLLLTAAGCSNDPQDPAPLAASTVPPAAVSVPAPTAPPRLLVFGDSIVAGAGSSTPPSTSFGYDLGEQLGWPTAISGVGGTGYLNRGPEVGLDLSYGARLQSLPEVGLAADVIVVEGGLNDRWQPADALAAAATSFLQLLRAKAPTAQVVVVGATAPAPDDAASVAASAAVNAVLSTVTAAQAAVFVDPVAENWFTPVNTPAFITADRIHPTDAGHEYMATRLAAHLRELPAD